MNIYLLLFLMAFFATMAYLEGYMAGRRNK